MTEVEVVEIVEMSRDKLDRLPFPYSRACLSVFVPYDKIHDVQKNIYTQLTGAEDIVTQMEKIGITEENGLNWAKNVVTGLRSILKTFKSQKDVIDERGISLYYEPSHPKKVYIVRSCAQLDDIRKSVICDDRFFCTPP